jgi:hypothetical protein
MFELTGCNQRMCVWVLCRGEEVEEVGDGVFICARAEARITRLQAAKILSCSQSPWR